MSAAILKECYLAWTLACIAGAYWPWAQLNDFTLRPFTEAISVWFIVGLAPVALADWTALSIRRSKALVRCRISTYP